MRTTFVRYNLKTGKNLLLVIFVTLAVFFGIVNVQAQTTRVWNGAGVSGGTGDNKLEDGNNWLPVGAPTILDSCVMNFGSVTGTYTLQLKAATTSLSMKALNIILTGSASAATLITLNITKTFTIDGSLSITNTGTTLFNDEINMSVSGTATVCNGALTVSASGKGAISFQNNTLFTINGVATFSNSGSMPVKFVIGGTTTATTTTFNKNVVFGTTTRGQWTSNLSNTIIVGGLSNTATLGSFVFNGDSTTLGFNLGIDKFNNGTLLFNGTSKQTILSYAENAPDRVPGTLKIGGGVNLSNVYYEKPASGGGSENDALVIRKALIINDNCLFSVRAVVVPSSGTAVSPDGLIQVNAGGTLVLGTKAGASSTLPDTYKTYNFNPTSTIIYDGMSRQTIYGGADYGNVEIKGADTAVKTAGGDLNILGNLLINAGKTFAASDTVNKTITVKGNWTNSGTFIPKTSTVSFDSSTNVTIGGSSNTDFYNLKINKTSGASVTMSKDVTVSDTVTLTAGELKLNGSKLTLNGKIDAAGTGTLTGSSASALYIGGTGTLGTLNFTSGAQTLGELTMNRSAAGLATMGTDLTVGTTAIFTNGAFAINGNTLTLNGTVSTTSGTLSGSATSNLVIGGAAGTLHFTPNVYPGIPNNNYLKKLTINSSASATIGDSLNIDAGSLGSPGALSVNGTLNANGNLTIKSQLLSTARITESTGSITGEVTVERFIPGRRAWRFVSVPFSSSTQTIRDAWQEGVNNTDPTLNYANNQNPHPSFGTHITGNNVTSLGYDYNTTVNPSIKVWDRTTNTWNVVEPPTISTPIDTYNAYCLFVRGSRAVNLSLATSAPFDNTVLRVKGILNETNGNSITRNFTGNAGDIIFIGNPFVSPINLRLIFSHSSGIAGAQSGDAQFYVWDPKLNGPGNFNVGGYVTYTNGVMAPLTGSYPSATAIIQSGQAFMVKLIGGAATMEFRQSDKKDSLQASVFGLQAATAQQTRPTPVIYTNLLTSSAGSMVLVDGVGTGFSRKFSAAVDYNDAEKLWNFDENLALIRNDKALAIELRPIPVQTDTLFYRMYLRQQPYTLQIIAQNLPASFPGHAWLVDKYLNTQTEVDLHDTTSYSFTPDKDTNSYRNRFMLVYNRSKDIVATNEIIEQAAMSTGIEQRAGVYPNPVTGNNFNLVLTALRKDKYIVNIYNNTGNLISTRSIDHESSNGTYNFKLPVNTITGNYTIHVVGRRGKVVCSMPLLVGK